MTVARRNAPAPSVDVHCHHLPPSVIETLPGFELRGGVGASPRLFLDGRLLGTYLPRLTDLALLMDDSDRYGLDVRALCAPSWFHCYWTSPEFGRRLSRSINDAIAEAVARHPGRLVGLATVPLQDVDAAIVELDRAVVELGFRGVAIQTHVNGRYLDDNELWPFIEKAADLGVPVFLHPTDVAGQDRMDPYRLVQMIGNPHESAFAAVRTVLGGLLDRVPAADLCFVQAGGSLPAIWARIEHTWNVREETRAFTTESPGYYLRRLYYDSITHSPETIEWLLRRVPDSQVLMGSDFPWDMGEYPPDGSIRAIDRIGIDAVDRMVGGNAARLLGLDREERGR